MGRRAAGVLLVLAAATACGGGDASSSTPLDRADDALAHLRQAHIELTMASTAGTGDGGSTAPVGFSLSGAYDLDAGTTFPVLDLTYTRLVGGAEQELTVQSDGDRLVVGVDGDETEVPPEQAGPLRKSDDPSSGVVDGLGIAGWVDDPTEADGPAIDGEATRRITGTVDVAELLGDLATLSQELTGEGVGTLDDAARQRLQALVQTSRAEVVVDGDGVPRQVHTEVTFGSGVDPQVAAEVAGFAGATLTVDLTVSQPGAPVEPPALT